jgi:hypothetical protein
MEKYTTQRIYYGKARGKGNLRRQEARRYALGARDLQLGLMHACVAIR